MTPSLALGTHLCRDVPGAAAFAAALGATWIDTAPNYRGGSAHHDLAPALRTHPDISVSTKVGFISRTAALEALAAGVITPAQAEEGHSLRPSYVRWQTERSTVELGRHPEVVFLHNPERIGERNTVLAAISRAFEALEELVAAGLIGGYGVATWSGFSAGTFTVNDLVDTAFRAAGSRHHLRAIQLPVSLVALDAAVEALDGLGPIGTAAAAGLDVFASSPLHGGDLPGMITRDLAELIRPGLEPPEAALHVVASTPGISRILLGTSNAAHWQRAFRAIELPPMTAAALREIHRVLSP
ncbi:aldo/keto reductase [Kitasatospora sp. NBC_01560]|uniref:aldo/keto reductase n=1 Tax=Kitasatospora sp. NBC_01560 TaxID=2975965 RepID=UPI00386DFB93